LSAIETMALTWWVHSQLKEYSRMLINYLQVSGILLAAAA